MDDAFFFNPVTNADDAWLKGSGVVLVIE